MNPNGSITALTDRLPLLTVSSYKPRWFPTLDGGNAEGRLSDYLSNLCGGMRKRGSKQKQKPPYPRAQSVTPHEVEREGARSRIPIVNTNGTHAEKGSTMEGFIQFMSVLAPAGGVGLALAAFAVSRLRRDPGIYIERGQPRELPADMTISW